VAEDKPSPAGAPILVAASGRADVLPQPSLPLLGQREAQVAPEPIPQLSQASNGQKVTPTIVGRNNEARSAGTDSRDQYGDQPVRDT
jgi:hypothetical protein